MEIDGFGVFKAFGGKFYKGRIFEEFMILTERLKDLRTYLGNHAVPINIYGSDILIGVGLGLALSAGYVGDFSSEMIMGTCTALTGGYLRERAGYAKRLIERTEILEERLIEVEFQGITSRDEFHEA